MEWSEKTETVPAEEENTAVVNTAESGLQLTCSVDDMLTYANIHNGAHIVRDICLKNVSETDLDHLLIRISSSNELTEEFKLGIEKIKAGEELHFKNLNVPVNAEYLAALTERSSFRLKVGIYSGDHRLVSETTNVTALAFDQWPGLQYTPELLAALRPDIWRNGQEIRPWRDISLKIRTGLKVWLRLLMRRFSRKILHMQSRRPALRRSARESVWRTPFWISIWEPVWI